MTDNLKRAVMVAARNFAAAWHRDESIVNPRVFKSEEAEKRLEEQLDLYTAKVIEEAMKWQPIETAPEEKLVIVGWLCDYDTENPDRVDFDYKEDGMWRKHSELYEEFICVAPPESRGPKENAPYTHWMDLQPLPTPPQGE